MHTYLFDVKLFASLPIKARTEAAARRKLDELMECVTVKFGAGAGVEPVELTADTEDGAELVEIDGEDA